MFVYTSALSDLTLSDILLNNFPHKFSSRFIRDDPVSFIQLPAGSAGNLHQTGKHLPKGKGYSFLYRLVQINMTQ